MIRATSRMSASASAIACSSEPPFCSCTGPIHAHYRPWSPWQGEGDDAAARRRAVLAAAAGDDDVFTPVDRIDRRRRIARGRQRRLPQQLAGELVVGAELLVE